MIKKEIEAVRSYEIALLFLMIALVAVTGIASFLFVDKFNLNEKVSELKLVEKKCIFENNSLRKELRNVLFTNNRLRERSDRAEINLESNFLEADHTKKKLKLEKNENTRLQNRIIELMDDIRQQTLQSETIANKLELDEQERQGYKTVIHKLKPNIVNLKDRIKKLEKEKFLLIQEKSKADKLFLNLEANR